MNLQARISRYARVRLIDGKTPIQRLHRIEEALGNARQGVRLFVKRDDLMALGGGGNKLRKLEFLLGEAQQLGADTIIAVGGRQSNHVRLAAASAARLGLACEVFLARLAPINGVEYDYSGNVMLSQLFGARVHYVPDGEDPKPLIEARVAQLRAQGRRPYVTAAGGTSPLSALGYASAAQEILEQEAELGLQFAQVVVPNGSSGTHAGLAAGFALAGRSPSLVKGFSVLAPQAAALRTTVETANATLALLDGAARIDDSEFIVIGDQRGAGYGQLTDEMVSALRFMAMHEGMLLDPVYSAKAFAGLLTDVRHGAYRAGDNILFLMTGGEPGLYAYRDALSQIDRSTP